MKCAPAIWKKFSKRERELWTDFYETFMAVPETFHADWTEEEQEEQREVTAHNMACQATWLIIGKTKDTGLRFL